MEAAPAATCRCPALPTTVVNTVDIALAGPRPARDWVLGALDCPAAHVVNHLPAHPTVLARRDPAYRAVLNRAVLNVADGMGVVWAARSRGHDQPDARVYGPDFLLDLAAAGIDRRLRHAFVGGTPASLTAMLANLRRRVPGLRIAGATAPPFRPVTPEHVAEDLDAALGHGATADVLWVGLGTPKQQVWADLARAHAPARVLLTVGAAFDLHAGTVAQAPAWMRRSGLEWAYRLAREPRRLFGRYVVGNARFVAGVAADRLRAR